MVNRRVAVNVPDSTPGRGLTADGAHLITALPQASTHGPAELVKAIAAAWEGPTAPAVRMLPAVVPYSHILVGTEDGRRVPVGDGLVLPLGIAEADLRPVTVDFGGEPHLIAYGDSECGKTGLLRTLAETIRQ